MDLTIIRGDTRLIKAQIVDAQNQPIDITGGTVFFTLNKRSNPDDDSQAIISKDITSFTNASQGRVDVLLESDDTNDLQNGTYYYDIQFVSQTGVVISKPRGKFIIKPDITRRTE
jgi:hypothetical protein